MEDLHLFYHLLIKVEQFHNFHFQQQYVMQFFENQNFNFIEKSDFKIILNHLIINII